MISASRLAKNYGPQSLFEGVTLQLDAGSRYGLVGANGSGKTTLLRILAGDEPASDGSVTYAKGLRLGVLRQNRFVNDAERIVDVAMQGDDEVYRALREQDGLSEGAVADPERLMELHEVIERHDGYSLESRAREVLVGLGLSPALLDRPLGTLSGGFKLRVLLAQVLVGRPDAVLLDEPTNHLDILSIRWLEQFLRAYKGCAVVISHDRRFLDAVVNRVLDVDYASVLEYPGNYTRFVEQKQATRERKEAEIAKAEKLIAHKKAFVERFKAKATKARQAQSRVKQIERIEVEVLPASSRRYPRFRFEQVRPSGRDVLTVEELSKSYGANRVLDQVSFAVRRGERVAVIGANGVGKSTLLEILTGHLAADVGSLVWGHEAKVGYFSQSHREIAERPGATLLDYLWDACPTESPSFVRGHLGRVLFSGDEVKKELRSLSGGEAARAIFAHLAVEKPNVLVLDEPTNHLDLEAIEALTAALSKYEGTLVFVSHDRHFVSELATRVIELTAEGLTDFMGGYDDYLAKEGVDHLDAEVVALKAKRERRPSEPAPPEIPPLASARGAPAPPGAPPAPAGGVPARARKQDVRARRTLERRRDQLLAEIASIEAQKLALAEEWAAPSLFEGGRAEERGRLERAGTFLEARLAALMQEWESVEESLASA